VGSQPLGARRLSWGKADGALGFGDSGDEAAIDRETPSREAWNSGFGA
jgi:hypothetical protein